MHWPWNILVFPQLDSTNRYAKELPSSEIGTVVLALEQTAGYGAKGNRWVSSLGESLTFSLILPWAPAASLFPLTVGVATARALERCGVPVQLKWPNDLVLFGGKLGGILVESVFGERAVAGIGLNLRQPPREFAPEGVGLESYPLDAMELVQSIAQELEPRWEQLQKNQTESIRQEWEALSCTLGREIRVTTEQGVLRGRSKGLDPLGGLILQTETGQTIIYSGTVRKPDGSYA